MHLISYRSLLRLSSWVVVFILSIFSCFAIALADEPPRAVLRSARATQEGRGFHQDWTSGGREFPCRTLTGFGPYEWPRALVVGDSGKARIRFRTRRKPKDVQINSWSELDEERDPVGPAEEIPYVLKRWFTDGKLVAWDAVMRPERVGHYYMNVRGEWTDQRCDTAESARWAFHMKVKSKAS